MLLGSALGSTWFHFAMHVLFTARWLGSCLVPLGSSCDRYGIYSTRGWSYATLVVCNVDSQLLAKYSNAMQQANEHFSANS